ncbi:hypothetical protein BC332_25312 [Capsicum chinense]|nr:hypothetical protein BC332_25312 [Capsicum chinense]
MPCGRPRKDKRVKSMKGAVENIYNNLGVTSMNEEDHEEAAWPLLIQLGHQTPKTQPVPDSTTLVIHTRTEKHLLRHQWVPRSRNGNMPLFSISWENHQCSQLWRDSWEPTGTVVSKIKAYYYHNNGYVQLNFSSIYDKDSVLSPSPYMFKNKPMILMMWPIEFNFVKEILLTIPLRV